MEKITMKFIFLFCLTTALYSQRISEKEGMGILKQIRKEAEKIKVEEKKGKKIIEDIRRDINESLEEKVFRSDNNPEARIAAAGVAFKIGKERMAFLKMEEEEIVKLEEVLGMEPDENRVFLSQKFDEAYDQFNSNNNEIELLLLENEKLNEYLTRLDRMEQKVRAGN